MDRIYVMQLVRSFQRGQIGRREFLRKATIAVGSVAAANTLLSACGTTPDPTLPPAVEEPAAEAEAAPTEELAEATATQPPPTEEAAEAAPTEEPAELTIITETVEYEDTDGETLMGYLARPADDEAHPAIIVIQEWWGLDEHIEDITRRFADEGYVALAPDLYKGAIATEPDEAMKLVMELDMEEAVREIQRAMAFLREQEYVSNPQIAAIGYCMGGGLALQTALAEEQMATAVPYYGRPLDPEQAQNAKAPVLGFYGAEDQGIPVDEVEAMFAAFDEAGIESELHVYDGAGHAFFNDTRESYNEQAATDAWQRTLDWFGEKLQS